VRKGARYPLHEVRDDPRGVGDHLLHDRVQVAPAGGAHVRRILPLRRTGARV
ncbi:MAG: hypothetical protein AVDCRST_MAG78-1202, partial [uncultured Rubrobacteraceae bacterium]